MKDVFELLRITRDNFLKVTEKLSDSQLRKIPAGFNNNILWHMGHVVSSTQKLTYGCAGLPLRVPEAIPSFFAKGSSPKEWKGDPDIGQVKELLISSLNQIADDYENGVFKGFNAYQTSYGYLIKNIDDALFFANVHEGLHLGNVMSMKKLV